MSAWAKYATTSADVYRATVSAGKRGTPVAQIGLTGLTCTPVRPMQGQQAGELMTRLRWDTPYTPKEAYIVGRPGVQLGDVLHIDGEPYTVRSVNEWEGPRGFPDYTHVVLEDTTP